MTPLAGRLVAEFPGRTPDELFRLAADIEGYPAFIPWCRSARVLREDGDERLVDNHFALGPAEMHFLSRAVARRPERLDIAAADGPFRSFRLIWQFQPIPGGCRVAAEYRVVFRSPLLQGLARLAVHEIERRVLKHFRARAAEVYGGAPAG